MKHFYKRNRKFNKSDSKHFTQKCCGCCKWYGKVETIVPNCCVPGPGGEGITAGTCALSGRKVFNKNSPCKQWGCKDGVVIDENHKVI